MTPIGVLPHREALKKQFSQLDMRHVQSVDEARMALALLQTKGIELSVAVGAIPAHAPTTPEELLVYDIARYLFSQAKQDVIPASKAVNDSSSAYLQRPAKPIFLDMACKVSSAAITLVDAMFDLRLQPIMTLLRKMSEDVGWHSVTGLDVLVELKVSASLLI